MHVREIPPNVFNQLAEEPQTIDTLAYISEQYPFMRQRELQDLARHAGETKIVGRADGLALALVERETSTIMEVHSTLGAAITNAADEGLAQLIAGRRSSDAWSYRGGEKYQEGVWLEISQRLYSAEKLGGAMAASRLLGRIATIAHQLLESGVFETSTYFERDVQLSSDDE